MAFSSDNDKLMVTAYSILSDEIKNNISEMSKSKKEQICYKICRNANFTEKKYYSIEQYPERSWSG